MDIKKVSDFLSVSEQIHKADVEKIIAAGFKTVINNRPDKEADDQPLSVEIRAEVLKHGLNFVEQPVISGQLSEADINQFRANLETSKGPVLAFCRTGTRCINLWALNEARHTDVDVILNMALDNGFNLSGQRDNLLQIAAQSGNSNT